MSVLGPCSSFSGLYSGGLYSGVFVALNEATTIAAAYALSNFMYVDDTNIASGLAGVYVGAPANNAATTGVCTGTGSTMACTAAGLPHAVQNALNLVNSVNIGSKPNGVANNTVPGNPNASVPVAMVNTLASIMEYCVDSTGGSGTSNGGASDGTHCGNVFSNSKSVTCSVSACVPQDTLTAMQTIAKNPTHNVTTLFGYVGSTPSFAPALSALTSNGASLSLGITYAITGTVGSSTTELFPEYLALDANDNMYVLSGDAASTATTQAFVNAISGSGAPLWSNPLGASFCTPRFLATDTVGNVWVTNNVSTSNCTNGGTYAIDGLSQTSGIIQWSFGSVTETVAAGAASTAASPIAGSSLPDGIAVDQYNNLWFDRGNTSTAALFEIPYSGGASGGGTYATQVRQTTNTLSALGEIELDGNQNVWFSTIGGSSTSTPTALYVLPNQNAANLSTAPSYTVSGSAVAPYSYTGGSTAGYTFGFAIDSGNNGWAAIGEQSPSTVNNWTKLAAPTSGGVITGNPTAAGASTTFAASTKEYESEFDGGGQLWYTYYSTTGEIYFVYNPLGTSVSGGVTQSVKGIVPCYAPNTATTCTTTAIYDPRSLQVDSTGSVWIAGNGNTGVGGYVVQLIGSAYPTWPQRSYAHFSVMPQ